MFLVDKPFRFVGFGAMPVVARASCSDASADEKTSHQRD
jgi:hypothetical protein